VKQKKTTLIQISFSLKFSRYFILSNQTSHKNKPLYLSIVIDFKQTIKLMFE